MCSSSSDCMDLLFFVLFLIYSPPLPTVPADRKMHAHIPAIHQHILPSKPTPLIQKAQTLGDRLFSNITKIIDWLRLVPEGRL